MGLISSIVKGATSLGAKVPGAGSVTGLLGKAPGGNRFPGVGASPRSASSPTGAGVVSGPLAPYQAARQGYADMLGIKNFTPVGPAPAVAMPGVTSPASPAVTPPHVFNFVNRLSWRGKSPRPNFGYGQSANWLDRWERNQSTGLAKKMGEFGG